MRLLPPGVLCVPGEIWAVLFCVTSALWKKGSTFCPFAPELQGVYIEEHDGRSKFGAMSSSLVMRKAPC
ncbi:hypothetical protein ACLK19_04700 [Escherichia coli]